MMMEEDDSPGGARETNDFSRIALGVLEEEETTRRKVHVAGLERADTVCTTVTAEALRSGRLRRKVGPQKGGGCVCAHETDDLEDVLQPATASLELSWMVTSVVGGPGGGRRKEPARRRAEVEGGRSVYARSEEVSRGESWGRGGLSSACRADLSGRSLAAHVRWGAELGAEATPLPWPVFIKSFSAGRARPLPTTLSGL
ncbi:hypothetical protein KM043_014143 [Ampulex compressa]|nr:hypothetical protein KM043_014143 [Ampulex compressa]